MGAQHGWDSLAHDVARCRRDLEQSERADLEARVVNRDRWLASLEWRRARLRTLEDRLADQRAREEADAELDYGGEAA